MSNSDFEASCGESQRLQPIEPNFNLHTRSLSTRSYVSDATWGADRNVVQKITHKSVGFAPMKYYFRVATYDLRTADWIIITTHVVLLMSLAFVVLCL